MQFQEQSDSHTIVPGIAIPDRKVCWYLSVKRIARVFYCEIVALKVDGNIAEYGNLFVSHGMFRVA